MNMKKLKWLFGLFSNKTINAKPLSFSEYRVVNAIFIQQSINEKINPFKDSFILLVGHCYVDYLLICGVDVTKLFNDLQFKCNEIYTTYDSNIVENIEDIMNNITDKKYLFAKYRL